MKKQELIELLKSAEAGSDELNVEYYEWKYPHAALDYAYQTAYLRNEDRYVNLHNVSNSVDAALGEIPEEHRHSMIIVTMSPEWHSVKFMKSKKYAGDHKSLPIAILLAVVEAGE